MASTPGAAPGAAGTGRHQSSIAAGGGRQSTGAPARPGALVPTVTGIVPPAVPPEGISAGPSVSDACSEGEAAPSQVDGSPSCTAAALGAIDRARSAEGVPPMRLPAGFGSLSPAEQVFVVTNLERVDRGLPPVSGMVDSLDALAQQGVNDSSDPGFQYGFASGAALRGGGSNWAGGYASVLTADYAWMYDDGYGSANVDCTSPRAPGCWGHRLNVLEAPACAGCALVMGAAAGPSPWGLSYAEVIESVSGPLPPLSFSWSQVVASVWSRPSAPEGYRLASSGGAVLAFGNAGTYGSLDGTVLNGPIVGMASTPDGLGYWLVASDGGVFAFGDAGFYGSAGAIHLNRPIVGMASTPDGLGYWLVASDGGVFAFGDAAYLGSMGSTTLNRPIVGMAADPATEGYWLVAADGGIFSFGAPFFGSTGNIRLNRPIVGMAAAGRGTGYRFAASDGGVFDFGSAAFHGSLGNLVLNRPIVGMAADPATEGYWLVAADGGIFSFGGATFEGSEGGTPLAHPIVAMAATP